MVSLRNLDPRAAGAYLDRRGVPAGRRGDVLAVADGHPLTLSLVVDVIARDPSAPLDTLPIELDARPARTGWSVRGRRRRIGRRSGCSALPVRPLRACCVTCWTTRVRPARRSTGFAICRSLRPARTGCCRTTWSATCSTLTCGGATRMATARCSVRCGPGGAPGAAQRRPRAAARDRRPQVPVPPPAQRPVPGRVGALGRPLPRPGCPGGPDQTIVHLVGTAEGAALRRPGGTLAGPTAGGVLCRARPGRPGAWRDRAARPHRPPAQRTAPPTRGPPQPGPTPERTAPARVGRAGHPVPLRRRRRGLPGAVADAECRADPHHAGPSSPTPGSPGTSSPSPSRTGGTPTPPPPTCPAPSAPTSSSATGAYGLFAPRLPPRPGRGDDASGGPNGRWPTTPCCSPPTSLNRTRSSCPTPTSTPRSGRPLQGPEPTRPARAQPPGAHPTRSAAATNHPCRPAPTPLANCCAPRSPRSVDGSRRRPAVPGTRPDLSPWLRTPRRPPPPPSGCRSAPTAATCDSASIASSPGCGTASCN